MDAEVDIETLATCPTAVIVSIGAVKYDIESGLIRDPFYVNIDPKTCVERGLVIQQDTIDWWWAQPKEVRRSWQKDPKPLDEALNMFYNWLDPNGHLSCYGLNFDVPIIENAFRSCGTSKMPWKYAKLRCSRTIGELYGVKPHRRDDEHHNALADARAQAQMLIDIFTP